MAGCGYCEKAYNRFADGISVLLDNLRIRFDVAPRIIDGRTLVLSRFFSEAFGCQVNWIAETRTIRIASPPRAMNVIGFYA